MIFKTQFSALFKTVFGHHDIKFFSFAYWASDTKKVLKKIIFKTIRSHINHNILISIKIQSKPIIEQILSMLIFKI